MVSGLGFKYTNSTNPFTVVAAPWVVVKVLKLSYSIQKPYCSLYTLVMVTRFAFLNSNPVLRSPQVSQTTASRSVTTYNLKWVAVKELTLCGHIVGLNNGASML